MGSWPAMASLHIDATTRHIGCKQHLSFGSSERGDDHQTTDISLNSLNIYLLL